eukprot:g788.t1
MSGAGSGVAGTVGGSFFKAPAWVDESRAPGTTAQPVPSWGAWASAIVRLRHILYSPNLVWLLISAASYIAFPYDLEAAKEWAWPWVLRRVRVNVTVVLAYYLFWSVSLYGAGWSQRKFRPGRWPTAGNVFHNAWYSMLGTLQWCGWEVLTVRLWATGRLPFVPDAAAFGSGVGLVRFALWTVFVPVWRGLHFYFAHRLIHIKPLYKYVHSLHHRNTDIEPFAGMCMHPVEHAYYFSCVGPSLVCSSCSPFHFLYNGMHLVLSPAASHSGWEDHMQSDQFHFLHHARFECNYGSGSFPLDSWFGTFRERLGDSTLYTGAGVQAAGAGASAGKKAKAHAPAQLPTGAALADWLPGSRDDALVWAYTTGAFVLLGSALAADAGTDASGGEAWSAAWARSVAGAVAFGPIVVCAALHALRSARISARWPFHKEPGAKFGLHLVVGFAVGVMPVYLLIEAVLRPSGHSAMHASGIF